MTDTPFEKLLALMDRLDEAHIYYTPLHVRSGYLGITAVVPGQYWEIEFCTDGTVDVEIFRSSGEIFDESKISELLERFSD